MWQTPWDTCRCCRSSIAGTPIAISAAVPMATTSAPRAIALAISADTLMPPVMIRLIFSAPFSFRDLRARYKAKIVGTFGGLHVFGGRSGSAGPSVYGDKIRPRVKRRRQVRLTVTSSKFHADGPSLGNLLQPGAQGIVKLTIIKSGVVIRQRPPVIFWQRIHPILAQNARLREVHKVRDNFEYHLEGPASPVDQGPDLSSRRP